MIERAYYKNTMHGFLAASLTEVLGELTNHHPFNLEMLQRNAWNEQIASLQKYLQRFHDGNIFFEFAIPRMGKRVDVVLVVGGVIFVLEYKAGAKSHDRYAMDQVLDYALDLKNFHEGSHKKRLVPVLVATKAESVSNRLIWFADDIASPLLSNGSDLADVIDLALSSIPVQEPLDADFWTLTGYKPTPTIVEAAQALYRDHSVEEISRSDSGATNLTITTKCIFEIINSTKRNRRKSICFVTGVPGAGKTLAGLNISTQRFHAGGRSQFRFLVR